MTELVNIEGTDLYIKNYNNKMVVSFDDICSVHKCDKKRLSRHFERKRRYFIKDIDFFEVTRKELGDLVSPNEKIVGNPYLKTYLFTETGYLMIVKCLDDDIAWNVQRQLVNGYFAGKFQSKEQNDIPPELRIPLQMDWAKRQKYKINVICENFDCTYAKYISRIIGLIGETYDFDFAMKKYEELTGKKPKYAMDAIGYFPELQKMATDIIMFDYQDMLKRSGLNP